MLYVIMFENKPFLVCQTETEAIDYINADPRPQDYSYLQCETYKPVKPLTYFTRFEHETLKEGQKYQIIPYTSIADAIGDSNAIGNVGETFEVYDSEKRLVHTGKVEY